MGSEQRRQASGENANSHEEIPIGLDGYENVD
jgi:hypothetical protein